MLVKQVYELVNQATKEAIGETTVLLEDLTNVVDVGEAIFNSSAFDAYVKALVNHIGKVVFVNRPYTGRAPKLLMDAWEFGSVLEKVRTEMPEATENESWELQDGASYDPNIFYKPKVSVKFFNSKTTFEINRSITELQVKQSFSSAVQLNAFISMLFNAVYDSLAVKLDALIMRTLNNFIAETVFEEYQGADLRSKSGTRAINLLYKYNNTVNVGGDALSVEKAMYDKEFIRYAAREMGLVARRMGTMSTLFNMGRTQKHTPRDRMKLVFLNEFEESAKVYLYSDTFHDDYVKLPAADTVDFWQGSGTDFEFDEVSKIHVKTSTGNEVEVSGVLAIMFDRDAAAVTNHDPRVKTNYNGKAEFTNYFYKQDAQYLNDFDENFVVFFIA